MRRPKRIILAFLVLLLLPMLLIACLSLYYFWPMNELPCDVRADRVIVYKDDRVLLLMSGDDVLKRYPVSLGRNPVGDKICQGDKRTPEGEYVLDWKNPNSLAYKSIHISYPNAADRCEAAEHGCSAGGNIMLHGIANGQGRLGRFHRFWDWTSGCIAVTDQEMEELYRVIPTGTPIEIKP